MRLDRRAVNPQLSALLRLGVGVASGLLGVGVASALLRLGVGVASALLRLRVRVASALLGVRGGGLGSGLLRVRGVGLALLRLRVRVASRWGCWRGRGRVKSRLTTGRLRRRPRWRVASRGPPWGGVGGGHSSAIPASRSAASSRGLASSAAATMQPMDGLGMRRLPARVAMGCSSRRFRRLRPIPSANDTQATFSHGSSNSPRAAKRRQSQIKMVVASAGVVDSWSWLPSRPTA